MKRPLITGHQLPDAAQSLVPRFNYRNLGLSIVSRFREQPSYVFMRVSRKRYRSRWAARKAGPRPTGVRSACLASARSKRTAFISRSNYSRLCQGWRFPAYFPRVLLRDSTACRHEVNRFRFEWSHSGSNARFESCAQSPISKSPSNGFGTPNCLYEVGALTPLFRKDCII